MDIEAAPPAAGPVAARPTAGPPPDPLALVGERIVAELVAAGVRVAASLPDSWLVPVIAACEAHDNVMHVPVTREEEAVSVVAGAALAGVRGVAVCQSAGVLLSANALAGFAQHHELPMVLLVADRGDLTDGYFYHVYKQRVLAKVLDALGIPTTALRSHDDLGRLRSVVTHAQLQRRPLAVLISGDLRQLGAPA